MTAYGYLKAKLDRLIRQELEAQKLPVSEDTVSKLKNELLSSTYKWVEITPLDVRKAIAKLRQKARPESASDDTGWKLSRNVEVSCVVTGGNGNWNTLTIPYWQRITSYHRVIKSDSRYNVYTVDYVSSNYHKDNGFQAQWTAFNGTYVNTTATWNAAFPDNVSDGSGNHLSGYSGPSYSYPAYEVPVFYGSGVNAPFTWKMFTPSTAGSVTSVWGTEYVHQFGNSLPNGYQDDVFVNWTVVRSMAGPRPSLCYTDAAHKTYIQGIFDAVDALEDA